MWKYFEIAYYLPCGGAVRTGIQAPNSRHALGMCLRGVIGATRIKVTREDDFTDDQRGYHFAP